MAQTTSYRLAEYLIVENAYGDLQWETHHGFGARKRGKCFIKGDILFLQPGYKEEHGFLKGEFLDRLHRLPNWEQTAYFCTSYRIYPCKSYVKMVPTLAAVDRSADRPAASQTYKLGRYAITKKDRGQWHWQASSGPDTLEEGTCSVKANILFIGTGETSTTRCSKREFRQRLKQLPGWNKTEYYCPSYTIYDCRTGALCSEFPMAALESTGGAKAGDVGPKKNGGRKNTGVPIPPKSIKANPFIPYLTFGKGMVLWFLKWIWLYFQLVFFKTAGAVIDTWRRFRR
jgi:hypothetical protein